jgi:hypothetical protein
LRDERLGSIRRSRSFTWPPPRRSIVSVLGPGCEALGAHGSPLLCVHDTIFPIQDYYLLLQHGDPKSARFFQGGHMGRGEDHSQAATVPPMVSWLCEKLGLRP